MKNLLLRLAVIGCLAPYSQFAPWLLENGLNVPLLIEKAFVSLISAGAWLDVIASAVTLFVMLFYFRKNFQALDTVIVVLGSLVAGVSLGLPLFFYFLLKRDVLRVFNIYSHILKLIINDL